MNEPTICVRNLGKKYQLHARPSAFSAIRGGISDLLVKPFGKQAGPPNRHPADTGESFWALREIDLDVREGEVVGVVGRNGAGKTTLLKILSRITAPTTGYAELRGRVGSLLEVGTGFNPELSGRENIYLSAAILGMHKFEIDRLFDEIVEFAGVPGFIDTAVKYYSSGMFMRLAFAVAAHLQHEILFIDEVLSVGDAAFQKKCVGKINIEARSGRTVLFVSHNTSAILSLCSRAILLEEGCIVEQGTPGKVVQAYLGKLSDPRSRREWSNPRAAPGNHQVRLKNVMVTDADGTPSQRFSNSEDIVVAMDYWSIVPDVKIGATIAVYNEADECIFGSLGNHEPNWHGQNRPLGLYRSRCIIPRDLMKEGVYRITILVWGERYTDAFRMDEAVELEIYDSGELRGDYFGGWEGVILPRLEWTCERLGDLPADG